MRSRWSIANLLSTLDQNAGGRSGSPYSRQGSLPSRSMGSTNGYATSYGLCSNHEQDLIMHSEALLQKLQQGESRDQDRLLSVFAAKLLNFVRNPFCVRRFSVPSGRLPRSSPDQALPEDAHALVLDGSRAQGSGGLHQMRDHSPASTIPAAPCSCSSR